jgi:hydrogenase nickel incorporation protein HypA/HybF
LSGETIARSAKLEVEMIPLSGKCRGCGEEFEMAEVDFVCPRCDNKDIEVISGTEMLMDRMEVE